MSFVATHPPRSEQERQITALAEGFGALLRSSQKFAVLEKELRSRLSLARNEYINLLNKVGDRTSHEIHVCEKLHPDNIKSTTVSVPLDVTQWISPAEEASVITPVEVKAISRGVQTWRRVGGVVATNGANGISNSMEKDFTTVGVQGRLHCPFTSPSKRPGTTPRDTCGRADLDPIKAQRAVDAPSSVGCTSAKDSAITPRCPIRYLENHSPEELAQYFEGHKHDLPRSHALCIQRYQKDSQSLRQIDEKYGDMVTMIKGLGQYHKPYLEGDAKDVETRKVDGDKSDMARIRNWADDVNNQSGDTLNAEENLEQLQVGQNDNENDDERKSHFERQPLREVRLGESPSRPWGIHVPLSRRISPVAPMANTSEQVKPPHPTIEPGLSASGKLGPSQCPFGSGKMKYDNPAIKIENATDEQQPVRRDPSPPSKPQNPEEPAPQREETSHPENGAAQPVVNPCASSMVFNGPVFFGFSADDTAALLQRLSVTSDVLK
ncbi:hypothetical protein KEM56_000779 [Ascosphaera pollenicola]|nr:hypothetical protein KEM56_000779 [Ascosphaera pollenicola]